MDTQMTENASTLHIISAWKRNVKHLKRSSEQNVMVLLHVLWIDERACITIRFRFKVYLFVCVFVVVFFCYSCGVDFGVGFVSSQSVFSIHRYCIHLLSQGLTGFFFFLYDSVSSVLSLSFVLKNSNSAMIGTWSLPNLEFGIPL